MTVSAQLWLFLHVVVMMLQDDLVTQVAIIAFVTQGCLLHAVAKITSTLVINVQTPKMDLIKNHMKNEIQINKYWLME